VNTRKFPLGVYEITGFQKTLFEPFNDRRLDPLVCGQPVIPDLWHPNLLLGR
jgi:hypothetical protein